MVNCAAFGCNNKAGKGSGLSIFHFPKDSNLLYLPDDSVLEVDDDEDGEGEVQTATYKLRQDTAPMDEKQFLVSEILSQ